MRFSGLSWRAINPMSALRSLWCHRGLLLLMTKRSVQERYRGSMLGLLWVLSMPLFLLIIYTFVFSVIFKARTGGELQSSKVAFAMTLFCGLTVYNIFSESLGAATSVIRGNQNYVKKVVFPLDILPVVGVLSAAFFGVAWFTILLLGLCVAMPQSLTVHAFCLPIVVVPLLFFCAGVAWFISSMSVYIRDTQHAVDVFLRLLFFMTPIIYSIDQVPDLFRRVLYLNPLTHAVNQVRRILIFGQPVQWLSLLLFAIFSLVVFQFGYIWFMKTRKGFADVL